jgi:hypothetical protein
MNDNSIVHPKKSLSMNAIENYTSENMQKIFKESIEKNDKIIQCLDYIRNYYELSDKMIENIRTFDDNTKMAIIQEYNKMFSLLHIIMETQSPIHDDS